MAIKKIDRRQFLLSSGVAAGIATICPESVRARTFGPSVAYLKVDSIRNPLGLENTHPRLSWRVESRGRNIRQVAYRIWVASTEAALSDGRGDLWDTGKVSSDRSIGIRYQGTELQSRQRCWWQVKIWDSAGEASELSPACWWEMGLLSPSDWTARWLAVEDDTMKADRAAGLHWIWGSTSHEKVSRKFRLSVDLPHSARNGVLLVGAGARHISVLIDGTRAEVEPPPRYAFSALPLNEIPLPSLSKGKHVFAVEVEPDRRAELFSKAGAMTAFVRLELTDGKVLRICANPEWRTSLSEESKWASSSYGDGDWEQAVPVSAPATQPWPPAPAMYLRKDFRVEKTVTRARLYATALGAYEARLNGHRVGDALLTPEITRYSKRVLYRAYDVGKLIAPGRNVLGLVVGDGWYASALVGYGRYAWGQPPRRVLAQLELDFSDGSREVVGTAPDWRVTGSPILKADIYNGELYDARADQPGWDAPGFDDSKWGAAEVGEDPSCRLAAHVSPPIRVTEVLRPRAIATPAPGVHVVDFGQNFAGWCRLHTKGESGTRVTLRFGETLLQSGHLDQSNLRAAKQTDVFVLGGDASGETLEPHFTYHGFRYVEVTGLSESPTPSSVEGIVIHSDLDMTGHIRSSHPLVQQIWRNTLWSQRSNFMGIPTDCPQRDERLGFMADAGVFWDAASFNMDVDAFTRRQMANALDSQHEKGAFSPFAPAPSTSENPSPGWSDGAVILPWMAWRRYGDLTVIEESWEGMNRYIQFILANNQDYIWRNKRSDVGDWLSVDQQHMLDPTTPHELVSTAYWAHSVALLAQMADALDLQERAASLRLVHDRIRQSFVDAFVGADGRVGNASQTSCVLALSFDLVPIEMRARVAERLVADIQRRGGALSTGYLGTQFILDVLADAGYPRLCYDLLLRTDYPSWGHMIEKGATTIWEAWNGRVWSGANTETMPNSYNHYTFGAVCGFIFRRIAGIDLLEPGFRKILIRPIPDARLTAAGGDYESVVGRISTDWVRLPDGSFTLHASIPANTSAEIHLPANRGSQIEEGGRTISSRSDMRVLGRSHDDVLVAVGSGSYKFLVSR